MQTTIQSRNRAPLAVKLMLLVLFLFGLAIILNGMKGMREYAESGFSAEAAYQAIYHLHKETDSAWKQKLEPQLQKMTEEEQEDLNQLMLQLLSSSWESQKKGGKDLLEEILAETEEAERESLSRKLLYATYLVNGPKVSSANRKAITAISGNETDAFHTQLLRSLLDETTELPAALQKLAGDLTGEERSAMLMQAWYVSNGSAEPGVTEQVNTLKKSVRDKAAQLSAFRMIARGEVSAIEQLVVGHSRTAILIGIVIAFNALLLTLLMLGDQTWRVDIKWIVILLIVDFLLLFQLMPLIYMLFKAFFPEGKFSLETIRRLHTYPLNLDAVKNTLIAATATMIFGTLLAFPLAWLVGRTNLYGRKFFRALFVLTYMVPPYVGALAWLRLLNPNVGTMNQWLRALLHLSDTPGPLNVYTLPGMIWVLTSFYYPYAFITISRAMEKMDPSLEEASRVSGASPIKTVFTVTLPMMLPSLISGALLVFVSAMSCYGIPSIIGSPGRVHTVTTRIVEYVSLGQQGLNDATGMAVFLMVLAVIILFLSDVVLAKRQYITVSGKSMQPTLVELRSWRIPLTILVSLFAVLVILIPFATILMTSFKIDVGKSVLAEGNFTLGNWETVFGRVETMNSLKNSLIFASVTATVGIVIACTMSYLLQRTHIRGRKIPDFLITLGSGTPSVVIALGLIMTMKGNFGINIYNTAYIMIIAYLIKYLMMGMRTVVSAMSQIHVSLEESSQISGASWSRTMFKITGPLIFPSIAAGWFLIFIPSFYELSMTTLLYSSTTKTIGFQLYEYWTFTSQPMSCAMAFGILLIVMLLNFILNRLTKGEFSI